MWEKGLDRKMTDVSGYSKTCGDICGNDPICHLGDLLKEETSDGEEKWGKTFEGFNDHHQVRILVKTWLLPPVGLD